MKMTRTELVKKLTSYAVVDESYAASFMESFLLLLHQRLQNSDSFKLPFKISFSQKKIVRNTKEFYLITCSSSDPLDTPTEDLVFAVPTLRDESKYDKYSVFSISVGKQIIPAKEMISSGFDFEPSFSLKKYCSEKAEALLQKGEFAPAALTPSDFAWSFNPSETEDHLPSDESLHEEIAKEVQEFGWDFGNSWKRELQEEEILSVQPSLEDVVNHTFVEETVEEPVEVESSSWNFGGDELEQPIATEDTVTSQTKIEEVDFAKLHEKLNHETSGREYEEVKAKDKTQELSIDLSEFEKLFNTEINEEDEGGEIQAGELAEQDDTVHDVEFLPVQSTSEFVLTHDQEKLLEESDPFSNFTVEKTESNLETDASLQAWAKDAYNLTVEKTEKDEFTVPDDEETDEEGEPPNNKKKGNKFWLITSVFLIVIIISVLYWKMWGIPLWLKLGEDAAPAIKIKPIVIEREYDIPVTYPYEVKVSESPKPEPEIQNNIQSSVNSGIESPTERYPAAKNEVEANDLFSKNNPRNKTSGKTTQTQTQTPLSNSKAVDLKETVNKKGVIKEKAPETKRSSLVRDNIYIEGSSYVVQLSSWKSEAIADQEVARLKRKGFKAFKTSAVVPQKGGTWYRVKVGGFSSAEEAARFFKVESRK